MTDRSGISGATLRAVLTRSKMLAPGRAVAILAQIAAELEADGRCAHDAVTPADIVVAADDIAYLADPNNDVGPAVDSAIDVDALPYLAPERLSAHAPADPLSVVYGLTCVLYECLIGVPPFLAGEDLSALVAAHQGAPIPMPSQQNPTIPIGFDAVIANGMAKDRSHRYPTPGAMIFAAQQALGSPPARPYHDTALTSSELVAAPQLADRSVTPLAPPLRRRSRRAAAVIAIAGAVAATTAIMAVVGLLVAGFIPSPFRSMHRNDQQPSVAAPPDDNELPFPGLGQPQGITVDSLGNVYVTDMHSLFRLAPGSDKPVVVTYPSLAAWNQTGGLAADTVGNVYFVDSSAVRKLTPGASDATLLPFPKLRIAGGLAVDTAGDVYVTDYDNEYMSDPQPPKVWKLGAGASGATEVAFPGLHSPRGIAVDSSGTLYVFDIEGAYPESTPAATVWQLSVGSTAPKRIFALNGLPVQLKYGGPECLAVSGAGDIFVNLGDRVRKLAVGSTKATTLPISSDNLQNVAVDVAGNVYITAIGRDEQTGHVLKLLA